MGQSRMPLNTLMQFYSMALSCASRHLRICFKICSKLRENSLLCAIDSVVNNFLSIPKRINFRPKLLKIAPIFWIFYYFYWENFLKILLFWAVTSSISNVASLLCVPMRCAEVFAEGIVVSIICSYFLECSRISPEYMIRLEQRTSKSSVFIEGFFLNPSNAL